MGNAAVVEGKAEPAFWRELQRPEEKRECVRNRPGGPGLDKAEGPPTPDEKPLGRLPGAWSSICKSLLLSDGVSQRKELPGRCQPNSPTRGQGESSPSGMGIKRARGLQVKSQAHWLTNACNLICFPSVTRRGQRAARWCSRCNHDPWSIFMLLKVLFRHS